jgi:hypothetical protein
MSGDEAARLAHGSRPLPELVERKLGLELGCSQLRGTVLRRRAQPSIRPDSQLALASEVRSENTTQMGLMWDQTRGGTHGLFSLDVLTETGVPRDVELRAPNGPLTVSVDLQLSELSVEA